MTSFVKGKIWRVLVVFLGRTCWRILLTCLICEPETRTDVSAVLVVTGVFVSPSSVVAECCDGVSLHSGREVVEPQSFFFLQKALGCVGGKSRRNE